MKNPCKAISISLYTNLGLCVGTRIKRKKYLEMITVEMREWIVKLAFMK